MYVGIDIGGTKTLVAFFDDKGVVTRSQKFKTPLVFSDFIQELKQTIGESSTPFTAACVAAPGRVNRETGTVAAFGNLPWKDIPLRDEVAKIVDCPTRIENDANLAGLSEAVLLKNTYSRVLYITISTGIGTGYVVNQVLSAELADSESGHMMLEYEDKIQQWEDFASGKAIVKRFGMKAEAITDEKSWRIIAHTIALGLINLIAVIQPQVIVFGGGVGAYFDKFAPYLEKELKIYETPLTPAPALRVAARPNEAVIYGCYEFLKPVHG